MIIEYLSNMRNAKILLNTILLTLTTVCFAACAPSSDSQTSAAPQSIIQPSVPTTTIPSGQPYVKTCLEISRCSAQAYNRFPVLSRIEIERQASAGGWMCNKKFVYTLARNELSQVNLTLALSLPEADAMGLIADPLQIHEHPVTVIGCNFVEHYVDNFN